MTRIHQNKYKIAFKYRKQFPDSVLDVSDSVFSCIADFTRRTENVRGIEFYENTIPLSPNSSNKMDVFSIENPEMMEFCFGAFSDAFFTGQSGALIQHTEGVLFPSAGNGDCWIALLEIKDCKPGNAAKYNAAMKQKVINSKSEIIRRGVGTKKNVYYGIASYPRKKLSFDDTIFNDLFEQKELFKQTGVVFFAANSVVIHQKIIEPIFK